MSRPESEHVTALRALRDRMVEARRMVPQIDNLDEAMRRLVEIETAIRAVDAAIENEQDLTPIPHVDDPTQPGQFPDSDQGPPLIERI
jgi:hypothetical protein